MGERKLTIKQIAQMAGVSETAVSFVINNRKGVSEQTRAKVHEIIASTNYVPNKSSQRLSFKKSFNICLAINPTSSPFSDYFYNEVTKGIVEQSAKYSYNIIIAQIQYDAGGRYSIPACVQNRDADGIIFLQDTPSTLLNEIRATGIPFVLVDALSADVPAVTINIDAEKAAYTATKYLIDKGHKDIGFIGSNYLPRYYVQTSTGYMRAMAEHSLAIRPEWFVPDVTDVHTAYHSMEKILHGNAYPSAVFCTGDIYAIGAINCSNAHGLNVPDDISFMGLDNILLSEYYSPPLTTIGYDSQNMGKLAMDCIINLIDEKPVEPIVVKSDTIIKRKSVKKI